MKQILFLLFFLNCIESYSQNNFPWERPLKISQSTDGINFAPPTIFQDSSGVPSAIKWKGDTLVCVFQWFRQPMNSATWDKVAVKFSYDNGASWTQPVPIIFNGLPSNYQRPFDPAIAVINSDSLRIYYSSSNGMPGPGMDSIINTYSSVSSDGINFTFENGSRFDDPTKRVIDPSAIIFKNEWHYLAPIGAPQDGAYHATSVDGVNFTQQANYLSDNFHNWTGNYCLENLNELRFYGSGQFIWYNSSTDGYAWNGYVNTNLVGGDPAIVKVGPANYFAVYVGQPYTTAINEINSASASINIDHENEVIQIAGTYQSFDFQIYSSDGDLENFGTVLKGEFISVSELSRGIHIILLKTEKWEGTYKFIK